MYQTIVLMVFGFINFMLYPFKYVGRSWSVF